MKRIFTQGILYAVMIVCLVSCYSVRLVSKSGTRNPCVHGDCDQGKWHDGFQAIEIDTVIKSSLITDIDELKVTGSDLCSSGKIHSVQFKNTFGGTLLYLVTFGSRRKVKITYICMKKEN